MQIIKCFFEIFENKFPFWNIIVVVLFRLIIFSSLLSPYAILVFSMSKQDLLKEDFKFLLDIGVGLSTISIFFFTAFQAIITLSQNARSDFKETINSFLQSKERVIDSFADLNTNFNRSFFVLIKENIIIPLNNFKMNSVADGLIKLAGGIPNFDMLYKPYTTCFMKMMKYFSNSYQRTKSELELIKSNMSIYEYLLLYCYLYKFGNPEERSIMNRYFRNELIETKYITEEHLKGW